MRSSHIEGTVHVKHNNKDLNKFINVPKETMFEVGSTNGNNRNNSFIGKNYSHHAGGMNNGINDFDTCIEGNLFS